MDERVPDVLLLHLGSDRERCMFENYYSSLREEIKAKWVTKSMSNVNEQDVVNYLVDHEPEVVLAADAGITLSENEMLQYYLGRWVKAGGRLILAYLFPRFVKPANHARFYEILGLPWRPGDCFRTTFYLVPWLTGDQVHYEPPLEKSYSMTSQNLRNVERNHKQYVPINSSRVESFILPPKEVDIEECPAAYGKCGKGWVGYIGDVNFERGSQCLLLSMISKLITQR